jgi:uncharacterized protein (TIGR02448 family)
MTKMILTLAVSLAAASAFAYPYHGGGWGYHHHPCYNCGPDAGDALTLGALFGSLSVSSLNCSANYDCKQVIAAQDDLNAFVVAQGDESARTAAVNSALQSVREANGLTQDMISDTDLAAALLSAQLQ